MPAVLHLEACETTHTPQGDGNRRDTVLRVIPCPKRPTPRKGTETLLPTRSAPLPAKQPTPRKGTETRAPCCRRRGSEKQPTPRKGTETRCSRRSCRCNLETTHTPQGDGNKAGHIQIRLYLETTHTPQGDGNCHRQRVAAIQRKQPTPRKGTETRLLVGMSLGVLETTHTPQGDGKPFVFTLQKLLEKPFTSPTGDN